jgi:hypothetical protein
MRVRTAAAGAIQKQTSPKNAFTAQGMAGTMRWQAMKHAMLAVAILGISATKTVTAAPPEPQVPRTRGLDELIDKKQPGIELVRGWIP